MEDIKVVITGFETIEEAEAFCSWYANQGEQDGFYWFEETKPNGTTGMICKKYKTKGNTVNMKLDMCK